MPSPSFATASASPTSTSEITLAITGRPSALRPISPSQRWRTASAAGVSRKAAGVSGGGALLSAASLVAIAPVSKPSSRSHCSAGPPGSRALTMRAWSAACRACDGSVREIAV